MRPKHPLTWPGVGLLAIVVGCGSFAPAAADSPTPAPTQTQTQSPTQTQAAAPSAAPGPSRTSYGFFAPYGPTTSSVVAVPAGFAPFYLQSVGRHGSRTTVSGSSFKKIRKLCADASADGELTRLGRGFCADANDLRTASRRIGYGELSRLGEQQWEEIGARTADDYRPFFTAAAKAKAPVRFVTSSVDRSQDSSDAFREGLASQTHGLKLKKRTTDNDLLRFSTPLTPVARAEIARYTSSDATKAAAINVLERLFGSTSTSLGDARAVWNVYAIAPGLGARLDAYLEPADAEQLAALDDADTYYRYGPSVKGGEAFESAADLRADLLDVIEHHADGGKTMATFRHAHAETVVPLAALLRLGPTSVPVARGGSLSDHGWYGSESSEMAVNLDVAAYRKGRTILVTVRFDESPVEVRGCEPSSYGRLLYDLKTLEECWS